MRRQRIYLPVNASFDVGMCCDTCDTSDASFRKLHIPIGMGIFPRNCVTCVTASPWEADADQRSARSIPSGQCSRQGSGSAKITAKLTDPLEVPYWGCRILVTTIEYIGKEADNW